MAFITGKNAVIKFGATTYACLTDISINGTGNTVSQECSTDGTGAATMNRAAGAEAWSVSGTMLLPTLAATIPNALDVATSGTLDAYAQGDAVGDLEYKWTTAVVSTHNVVGAVADFVKLDVTFDCDGAPAIALKAA